MAWTSIDQITLGASVVVGGPHTNKVIYLGGTDLRMRSLANGGEVTDASGFDVALYGAHSLGVLSSLLDFRRIYLDLVTGDYLFAVELPSMDNNLAFFLGIGNTAITTDQQATAAATFDSAFYWGVITGGSTTDQTGQGHDVTAVASPTVDVGLIGDAWEFNGSSQYLWRNVAEMPALPFCVDALFKPSVLQTGQVIGFATFAVGTGQNHLILQGNLGQVRGQQQANVADTASGVVNTTDWQYANARFRDNAQNPSVLVQVNGAATIATDSGASTNTGTFDAWSIGARSFNNLHNNFYAGLINIAQAYAVEPSQNWLDTADNMLRQVGTFYTQTPIGPVTTAAVVSQPTISVRSGEAFQVQIEKLDDGVRDTSFTGDIELTLEAGNGILAAESGSLIMAAVAGVSTFNVSITEDGGVRLDLHTLRGTLPTSQFVDTDPIRVRNTGLYIQGDYSANASFIENRSGTNGVLYYGIFTPADPPPPEGYDVFVCLGGSTYAYVEGWGGDPDLAILEAQTNQPSGAWCDDNKATFPFLKIDLLITGFSEDEKTQWRCSMPSLFDQLESDGYPINRRGRHWRGFSTGGIECSDLKKEYEGERVFASYTGCDGSYTSGHMTQGGAGPPSGPYDAFWFDPTGLDAALMPEMGKDWVDDGASILIVNGTNSIINTAGRDICEIDPTDPAVGWDTSIMVGMQNRCTELGYDPVVKSVITGTLVLDPDTKRQYTKSTTMNHGQVDEFLFTPTNSPVYTAWLLNQRTPLGNGTVNKNRLFFFRNRRRYR